VSYLLKYFPELDKSVHHKLEEYIHLLQDWNQKINLISRKETNIELHHVVHSLSIYKFIKFRPSTNVLDLGTGGGLPGIPLAIVFPEVQFTMVDSIRKKVVAVDEMIKSLGLKNAKAIWSRAEDLDNNYDFIVTRAVARVEKLQDWTKHLLSPKDKNALPNGVIALKGGDIHEELASLPKSYYSYTPLREYFEDPYFDLKLIVYFQ
jgi:16S rRNA (guanine527-N7)-methyltransferase